MFRSVLLEVAHRRHAGIFTGICALLMAVWWLYDACVYTDDRSRPPVHDVIDLCSDRSPIPNQWPTQCESFPPSHLIITEAGYGDQASNVCGRLAK
jgi:hypothetical protein